MDLLRLSVQLSGTEELPRIIEAYIGTYRRIDGPNFFKKCLISAGFFINTITISSLICNLAELLRKTMKTLSEWLAPPLRFKPN